MNDKTIVFWGLLRAGLWEDLGLQPFPDTVLSSFYDIDWQIVGKLGEEQSVTGLITAGIEQLYSSIPALGPQKKDFIPFMGRVLQMEQRNTAINGFIGELFKKMSEAGISAVLVKGQGIAQSYNRPLWRSCGDIDLFLNDDNYEKAKRLLCPLASNVAKEYKREKHLGLTIDSWVVELHGSLYCGLSSRIDQELDDVYKDTFYLEKRRFWNNELVPVPLLALENDAFYVFTHFLHHFYKGGIGLRQLCDWCRLLWSYRNMLNQRVLRNRLLKSGLLSAWKAFGAVAVDYLGMPKDAMPFYSDDAKWKRRSAKIKDFIMFSGNFGQNRDRSYFSKYPYVIRKAISANRHICDLIRHARIFPFLSLRFFPKIMVNGLKSAIRGE